MFRSVFITDTVEHEMMNNESITWDQKIAIVTSKNHVSGAMIPIKESIYQLAVAMILRKNSYFTDVFNKVIYQLAANGYINELNKNFKKPNQFPQKSDADGLLVMNDVVGLFGICLGGYVLAVAVFCYEIIYATVRKVKTGKKAERKCN